MQARHLFYHIVTVTALLAVLLPQGAGIPARSAHAQGPIPFVGHTIDGSFSGACSVYATDVDGDGDVDVLGAALYADDITWWENDGSEHFTEHTIDGNFNGAHSVYATDVDSDGDVDVLGAAWLADDVTWWENDGSEHFTKHTIDGNFDGVHTVYATDVDSDGDVDVLGAAVLVDDIAWWENDGSEHFTKHTIAGDFDGAFSVYATDVDSDGDVDVLGTAWIADDIAWWENDGSEHFTQHTIAGNFDNARAVYATDVDGDGDVDVLGAAANAGDITWWENDGSEHFTRRTIDGNFSGAFSVYATDVDGDGDVDVLGAAILADDIVWWENDGSERFTKHTIEGNFDSARSVYAADVDSDGDVDVLGAALDANDIAWWENTSLSDTTPPAAITDLLASTGDTAGTVNLSWTAPGDDGNTGIATQYILRYNSVPITEGNWSSSTNVSGEPTPSPAGSSESMTVSGLTPGQTYYFAVKTQDEVPNTSDISNSPSAAAGVPDTTPPATISDLSATRSTYPDDIVLSWTAPGDDGNSGTASLYMVRYNNGSISSESDWDDAFDVEGEPAPLVAGSIQTMTVSLTSEYTYYFAIRACDEAGNWGGISNSPLVGGSFIYLPVILRGE